MLFLDDLHDRFSQFSENWHGHDLTHVTNAADCIQRLQSEAFDLVMLDHDLSDEHYIKQCTDETTGSYVAQYIAARPRRFQRTQFVVHSLNHAGRNRMVIALSSAGLRVHDVPWGWLKVKPE